MLPIAMLYKMHEDVLNPIESPPSVLVNVQEGLFAYWSCTCVHQNQKCIDHTSSKIRPRSGRSTPRKTLMTEEETMLISESWDLVRQDLKGHGLNFFKQ